MQKQLVTHLACTLSKDHVKAYLPSEYSLIHSTTHPSYLNLLFSVAAELIALLLFLSGFGIVAIYSAADGCAEVRIGIIESSRACRWLHASGARRGGSLRVISIFTS